MARDLRTSSKQLVEKCAVVSMPIILGMLYRYLSRGGEALLREAIRMQPDFAGAHAILARCWVNSATRQAPLRRARRGTEIAKRKTSEQEALLSTNSGRRLLIRGRP